jgi:hypothetical protein
MLKVQTGGPVTVAMISVARSWSFICLRRASRRISLNAASGQEIEHKQRESKPPRKPGFAGFGQ